jgi:outer membrane lipopolysaccharide assembly protein LptE/RlpB
VTESSRYDDPNIGMLEIAVQALGDLCASLVFIGGCATGLLVTTVRAHHIRPTGDVDVVTRAATIRAYHDVETSLLARGFKHDVLPGDAASQARLPELIRRLRALAQ